MKLHFYLLSSHIIDISKSYRLWLFKVSFNNISVLLVNSGELDMFPLILKSDIGSMNEWLWYWKLLVSVMTKALWGLSWSGSYGTGTNSCCEYESRSWWGVLDATLCNNSYRINVYRFHAFWLDKSIVTCLFWIRSLLEHFCVFDPFITGWTFLYNQNKQ